MYIIKNKFILAGGVIIALLLLSFLIYIIFNNTTSDSDDTNAGAVSLTSSQEQLSADDTSSPGGASDSSATFQGVASIGECSIPSKVLDEYKDTTIPFEYEIKISYSSRKEVLEELYTLYKCYDKYVENIDFDTYTFNGPESSVNRYDKVLKALGEELKKFPMTDNDEIKQRRINAFYAYHEAGETTIEIAEAQFKDTGDEYYKRQYEKNKAIYDEEEIVRKDYEAGKITIEEALIRIGLPEYAEGTEELD